MPKQPPEEARNARRAHARVTTRSRDDLPEITGTVADLDARGRYQKAVAAIERHPRGPSKHAAARMNLRRFLDGSMAKHARTASPSSRRAWRSLRRAVPADQARRDEWLADFFTVVWTAQAAFDTDEASRATLRAGRAAMPSRWAIGRLKPRLEPVLRERERSLDPAMPKEEREAFYSERLREDRFTVPDGRELVGWLTVGDLLRPKRGPLRRPLFDSPAELLMGYLTGSLRLADRTAATITAALLLWTLGRRESEDRLRDGWRWARRNPAKAPPQP